MIFPRFLTRFYLGIAGRSSLLKSAQSCLMRDFSAVLKKEADVFFSYNGQTQDGRPRNSGEDRYFVWANTLVDCSMHADLLDDQEALSEWCRGLFYNRKFCAMKADLEERMGGLVDVQPFYHVVREAEKRGNHVTFRGQCVGQDYLRVGLRLVARDERRFKQGLMFLKNWDNPYVIKPTTQQTAFSQFYAQT